MNENDVAAFVLAGGESSRMGRDKALVPFAGQPLVARALATLREAGLYASIAGARTSLESYAPVIPDPASDAGSGPLAGICAALDSTTARLCVFLPIDLPLLPASLLICLLRHAQIAGAPVTVASVNGFAQTFPAVLDRSVLPLLHAELKSGRTGCFAAFRAAAASLNGPLSVVPAEFLVQSGQVAHPAALPAFGWFLNVNAPADLRRAETLLAGYGLCRGADCVSWN
jgi:molybdopterin-guanine dinucleotide biosynthesis protein A